MVVRAHRHRHSLHLISDTVVKAVGNYIQVVTAHRLMQKSFRLARTESRAIRLSDKCCHPVMSAPLAKIRIYLTDKVLTSAHSYYGKLAIQYFLHYYPSSVKIFCFR